MDLVIDGLTLSFQVGGKKTPCDPIVIKARYVGQAIVEIDPGEEIDSDDFVVYTDSGIAQLVRGTTKVGGEEVDHLVIDPAVASPAWAIVVHKGTIVEAFLDAEQLTLRQINGAFLSVIEALNVPKEKKALDQMDRAA